eukprot:GILJ01006593.1.p1 GENE.GILJ01006593.1~~GILJ01006593.1.p1  ORF type:complete len:209 (+),score=16.32 GILJ01006593.1:50-676(+)
MEKTAGDLKAEVHLLGQLVGAEGFGTTDGIFCEFHIETGEHWSLISLGAEHSQTQTSYPEHGEFAAWCHPFDLHYETNSVHGWPKLQLQVWKLDQFGRCDILSYGMCHLPSTAGSYNIVVPTWRPLGTTRDEVQAFFLGGVPQLKSLEPVSTASDLRCRLRTESSGNLHLQVDVILKNFSYHHISDVQPPASHGDIDALRVNDERLLR